MTEEGGKSAAGGRGSECRASFVFACTRREAAASCLAGAERGDVRAQYEAAGRYERGDGLETDFGKAFAWYRSAAEAGYAPACAKAALYCLEGLAGKKDIEAGSQYLKRGVAASDELSLLMAGECALWGIGEEVDRAKARGLFGHPLLAAPRGAAAP